jgi:hypothetical protein
LLLLLLLLLLLSSSSSLIARILQSILNLGKGWKTEVQCPWALFLKLWSEKN